jgi:hypothetical protein
MDKLPCMLATILLVFIFCAPCNGLAVSQTPSLQKYAYVFEAPQKSALGTVKDFMPTCQAIEKNDIRLASTGAPEYSQSEETARQALERAQALSGIVEQAITTIKEFVRMVYSTNAVIPSDSLQDALNSFARPCNAESFESIRLVLLANSQAWEKLSAKAESFRRAYGDSGPAGRCEMVRAKLVQIESEFEAGSAGSDSLAARALALQKTAQREATDGALLSPRNARTAIVQGISADSVLSEIYSFDAQITDALLALDASYGRQKNDAEAWQALAEGALKKYQDGGMASLDGLGLFSRIPARFTGTTATLGGFRETERLAQDAIMQANRNMSLAEFSAKAMQYGYESESIARYADARAGFEQAVQTLGSKADEATALESAVNEEAAQRIASIREKLAQLEKTDALSAQKIAQMLDALEKAYEGSQGSLAQRLAASADLLSGIGKIEDALLAENDNALLELTSLMHSELMDLIGRAARDDVPVQYETTVAATIKQSLDLAKSKKAFLSTDELSAFQQQISLMDAKIVERAHAKYSFLDSQYATARSLEPLLGVSDLAKLDSYGAYFLSGKLDARGGLGRLSEMSGFFSQVILSCRAGLGEKVQGAMQQSLYELPQKNGPVTMGEEALVKRSFSCKNPLGLGYDSAIQLKLFSIPGGAKLLDATGKYYEVNGVVYARLQGASAHGEYVLDVEYALVAARKTGETTATVYSDSSGTLISKTITFQSEAQCDVLLEVAVPGGATAYCPGGYSKQYQSQDTAAFVVPAKVGRNEVEVVISSAGQAPFVLYEKKTQPYPQKTMIELSYTNVFDELQNPKIAYTQAECTSLHSLTVESADFSWARAGNDVRLSFAGKWARGQQKRAVLTIECDNATQTAAQQAGLLLAGYDSTLQSLLVRAGIISGFASASSVVAQKQDDIAQILASASSLPEYASVLKIAGEAQATLQQAAATTDAAAQQKAANNASAKLSELESLATYRFTALYKQCDYPSCKRGLEEARALVAAKDWPAAFQKLAQYQKEMEQAAAALVQEYSEKLADYSAYAATVVPAASSALSRFDNATALSTNQSSATYSRLKGEGYDHAAARKVRDQLAKAMEKIKESYSVASKAFNASSKADLSGQYANVEGLAQQLDGYTDKLASVTQAQLSIARQSAAGVGAEASLSAADSDAADGNYLSAYLLAKQLQQEAAGPTLVKAGDAFSVSEYLPYLAAVVILAGVGFAYLKKGDKEGFEALDKPPDDYAN